MSERRRFSPADETALVAAAETGELPDGRIATQQRMAEDLGFSRRTIAEHCRLAGLKFARSAELMSAGGKRSAYVRRLARLHTIAMAKGAHR